jgi:hypothetical protein
MGISAAKVKEMILALPGVEEGTSYGEPAYKLCGKFFVRLRDEETALVLPMSMDDREVWMEIAPEIYFVSDHYRNYPYVLLRLAKTSADEVAARLEHAWRAKATKEMVEAFDESRNG